MNPRVTPGGAMNPIVTPGGAMSARASPGGMMSVPIAGRDRLPGLGGGTLTPTVVPHDVMRAPRDDTTKVPVGGLDTDRPNGNG